MPGVSVVVHHVYAWCECDGAPCVCSCTYVTHVQDMQYCIVMTIIIVSVCPQVIQEENLQASSKALGEVFMRGLLELRNDFDCVGDVRGKGLMLGLELVENKVIPVSVLMDVCCAR